MPAGSTWIDQDRPAMAQRQSPGHHRAPMPHRLTKSLLLSYLQCPRKLWLEVRHPERAVPDAARLARFETGNQVGGIARDLYGAAAVRSGANVEFETRYVHDNVLVRADVIERPGLFGGGGTGIRLIEVKASSGVKQQHLADCAIQACTMAGAGDPAQVVAVAHIDSAFTYSGGGNYRGLLKEADVTARVLPLAERVPKWARSAQDVLGSDAEPPIAVGTHCFSPRPCPFIAHCWPKAEYPLTSLPNLRAKLNDYVARGYRDVRDVPEGEIESADALRVWRVTREGRAEVGPGLGEQLRALAYPRFYLDFETIGPCVPIWPGTKPNQAIPYQWSIHVERAPGAVLEHLEHLDLSGDLPARGVAQSLVRALADAGPVITYSAYERQCLRILAALVPEVAAQLQAIEARIFDLLPLMRRDYYHPAMRGSWSIKVVLPTIVPQMRYDRLGEVRDGEAASRAWLQAIRLGKGGADIDRREAIRGALLTYCAFDTEAMARIVRALQPGRAPLL